MDAPDSTTKICTKCKTEYPATTEYFHRDKTKQDGMHHICKSCRCESERKRLENDVYRERHRVTEQQRRHNDPNYAIKERLRYHRTRKYNEQYKKARAKAAHDRFCRKYQSDPLFRQRVLQQNAQWIKNNPDKNRAKVSRRRALKLGVETAPFDIRKQLRNQKGKCYYCGCKLDKYHVDHVIPLSRGGSDLPENKVLACPSCNIRKKDKYPHEWAEGGRLL